MNRLEKVYKFMDSALEQYGSNKSDLHFGRAQGAAKLALELSIITADQFVVYSESLLSLKQDNRICRSSSRLISSLDQDSRYIKFHTFDNEIFTAIVCSSLNDEELSDIYAGDDKFWKFTDRQNALRSIRRLNKNVPVYMGTSSSASSSKID